MTIQAIKPIVVFHEMQDACVGQYNQFAKRLGEETKVYSKCIEIGWIGVLTSLFVDMESQGKKACEGI